MKKLFTLLVLIFAATTTLMSQDFTYEGINYTIINEDAKTCMTKAGSDVLQPGNTLEGDVSIPESVLYDGNNYTVIFIGDYSFAGNQIKNVMLSNTVKEIGPSAFRESDIISIKLNDGLKRINDYAFYNCKALLAIEMPNTITDLGTSTFERTISIESVELSNSITLLTNNVFKDCSSLKSIKLPDSITEMGSGGGGGSCFSGCTSLVSVELSNNLTYFGWSIFENCTSLESIYIPDSVTTLNYSAFRYCI